MSRTLAEPEVPTAANQPGGRRRQTPGAGAVAWAVILAAGASSLFLFNGWWRSLEVSVSSWIMSLWSGQKTQAVPSLDTVVLYHHGQPQIAFDITTQCSVGYIVGILMFFAAALVLVPRLRVARVLEAFGAAAVILLVTNVGRIAFLGVAVAHLGVEQGLVFGHVYLGSVVTLVGATFAGIAFVGIIGLAVRSELKAR